MGRKLSYAVVEESEPWIRSWPNMALGMIIPMLLSYMACKKLLVYAYQRDESLCFAQSGSKPASDKAKARDLTWNFTKWI